MSNQEQTPTPEPQKDKNTRYFGYLVLTCCLLVVCIAVYYLFGAFVTGVVGVGGLASLFRSAAGV